MVVDPADRTDVGDRIDYTFVATNTGNVAMTDVEITDPLDGLSPLDCTPAAPATPAARRRDHLYGDPRRGDRRHRHQ